MDVGNRIKQIRLENNLTQKKLSKLSNVSEISIRKYENSDRLPKAEQIKKIAEALSVAPDWLMGWSEKKAVIKRDLEEFSVFNQQLKLLGYDWDQISGCDYESKKIEYEENNLVLSGCNTNGIARECEFCELKNKMIIQLNKNDEKCILEFEKLEEILQDTLSFLEIELDKTMKKCKKTKLNIKN